MFGSAYYQISSFFNFLSSLLIGFFVLSKNRRNITNIMFFAFAMAVSFWAINYFFWQASTTPERALFFCRTLTLGSTSFPITFYHFTVHFLHKRRGKNRLLLLGYFLWLAFIILTLTPLMVREVTRVGIFPFWPMPGPLYLFYLVYFLGYSYSGIYLMYMAYRRGSAAVKNQLRWIFLGIGIGLTGGSSNYFLWYHIPVQPVGNILVGFYPLFVGYAIIRYRAMEIDTVLHKTILWLMTLLLLVLPLGLSYALFKRTLFGSGMAGVTGIFTITLLVFLFYYNRLKPRIDHFFRRRKNDYQLLLAEMPGRIGSSLDLERLCQNLFHELKETLYVRNTLLMVKLPKTKTFETAGHAGYTPLMKSGTADPSFTVFTEDHPLLLWLKKEKKAVEREQVEIDPGFRPVKEEALAFLAKNSLEVLLPIPMQDDIIALLGLGRKENLQPYRIKDIELLEHIAPQLGITIDNALHHQDIVEKERIAEELRLGKQIQISLLPPSFPDVPYLSIGGIMQPAKEIGGDYYDFITLPDRNKLGIVIGDVSGKGLAAGLLMAMAKTAIHIFSAGTESPRQTLMSLNDIFNKQIGGERFMTMLYLIWQPDKTSLTYSSAGHENMIIYRHAENRVEVVESGGIMLGVVADVRTYLEEKEIRLQSRDKILLYTDGVTEALNPSRDRYGLKRLTETFMRHSRKGVRDLMESLRGEIYGFMDNCPQYDDITLVVLEACGESGKPERTGAGRPVPPAA